MLRKKKENTIYFKKRGTINGNTNGKSLKVMDNNFYLGSDAEFGKFTEDLLLPSLKPLQNLFTAALSKELFNGVLPPKVVNLFERKTYIKYINKCMYHSENINKKRNYIKVMN